MASGIILSSFKIFILGDCFKIFINPAVETALQGMGHICLANIKLRIEENSPCKKITFSQPEDCRKKGRPKLRWLDCVLKTEKLLKVEAWWKKAGDRNIWGRIIKEAKVHNDCRARGRRISNCNNIYATVIEGKCKVATVSKASLHKCQIGHQYKS
jgi:hypothetical protein